jgi:DNA-binding NarL/FixJ family response regulator
MRATSQASDHQIQVVLVARHLALRKGIELLLGNEGLRVIGVAQTASEGVRMIKERNPDVAIVDIGLVGRSGLGLVREVLAADRAAGILLYTGTVDRALLQDALNSGARGFALKAGRPEELIGAVRIVAAGGEYVDPRIAELLELPEEARPMLTSREREILDLLAEGLRTDEVAARLAISPLTVDTHVRNVMRKLGARTRAHALALALRLHEIELAEVS